MFFMQYQALTDELVKERFEYGCPFHGDKLVQVQVFKVDKDTGRRKYSGEFFGCPKFRLLNCRYQLSIGTETRAPRETFLDGMDPSNVELVSE